MTPENVKTISLANIQTLLDEIDVALAPTQQWATQAVERLDSERVDANAWCSLKDTIGIVRMRLNLLARIALRLQHGISVTELMRSEDDAKALVKAFGETLKAATIAVGLDGVAPKPDVCTRLEAKLAASSNTLTKAWISRQGLTKRGGSNSTDNIEVTVEILAGTAANTLLALLEDAAELLSLASAVASTPSGPVAADVLQEVPKGTVAQTLDLPDLTERLKEAGMYDEYITWREGYLRWRQQKPGKRGDGKGAKGEIASGMGRMNDGEGALEREPSAA